MGFLADPFQLPKFTNINVRKKLAEGAGLNLFLPVFDIPGSTTVSADDCNFSITDRNGTISFRNPACSPPPPPPPPPPPTPKGNDCEVLYCNNGSTISAVISARQGTVGNPGGFSAGTDAQIVMDYNYNLAALNSLELVRELNEAAANSTTVHPLIKNVRAVVEPFGSEGFFSQTEGLALFEIATTTHEVTVISSDDFTTLDNPPTRLSRYDGNIEIKLTQFVVRYQYLDDDETGTYVSPYTQCGYWIATRFKNRLCPLPAPPPPPPPKMECCPGQSNNDALLKLILKRIGTLPVDVQTSYLTKTAVQPAQLKKIESLTEFIAWFAERFDEVIGEFEITVEVDDTDLTKQGKQKQTIRLPNLAEAIAEMFTLVMHGNINNELILNIVNRTLIESGQIKQSEFKTFSALNALIDYIGFHTSSKTEKMPLTFKPGELSFDKVLKEAEVDVAVLTYDKKETLMATMQTLLQAAAIIRAVHYRRTPGTKEQIASAIEKDLKGLLGESGNLTDQVKTFITNMEKVYDGIDNKPK